MNIMNAIFCPKKYISTSRIKLTTITYRYDSSSTKKNHIEHSSQTMWNKTLISMTIAWITYINTYKYMKQLLHTFRWLNRAARAHTLWTYYTHSMIVLSFTYKILQFHLYCYSTKCHAALYRARAIIIGAKMVFFFHNCL